MVSSTKKPRSLGIGMLLVAVVLYSVNSELYTWEATRAFDKPYLTIWFGHVMMAGILPAATLYFALHGRALQDSCSFFESLCYYYGYNPHELRPVCRTALFLSTLYMVQNYAFVKALEFSSAGIDTAISQSASALVYLFSIFILNEEVLLAKVVAVALCVIGHQGSGASPPARAVQHQGSGASPPTRAVQHQGSGASPPARAVQHQGSGASPPARAVQHQGSGASPPTRAVQHQGSGASPPARAVQHWLRRSRGESYGMWVELAGMRGMWVELAGNEGDGSLRGMRSLWGMRRDVWVELAGNEAGMWVELVGNAI
ncbi:hypothetical protein CYMTET_7131, partial [Cymbomonas tetramitiformis]